MHILLMYLTFFWRIENSSYWRIENKTESCSSAHVKGDMFIKAYPQWLSDFTLAAEMFISLVIEIVFCLLGVFMVEEY